MANPYQGAGPDTEKRKKRKTNGGKSNGPKRPIDKLITAVTKSVGVGDGSFDTVIISNFYYPGTLSSLKWDGGFYNEDTSDVYGTNILGYLLFFVIGQDENLNWTGLSGFFDSPIGTTRALTDCAIGTQVVGWSPLFIPHADITNSIFLMGKNTSPLYLTGSSKAQRKIRSGDMLCMTAAWKNGKGGFTAGLRLNIQWFFKQ